MASVGPVRPAYRRTNEGVGRAAALGAALLLGCATARVFAGETASSINAELALRVRGFDNHNAPLIPTLLSVAAEYSLPMGIEKVTPEAMGKPISVRVQGVEISKLLTACVRQLAGYRWAAEAGTINVFGKEERTEPSNLLNFVLPSFQVRAETLNEASDKLRISLELATVKPEGIEGSLLGNPDLERRRMSFSLRRATVREVLNQMVALDGGAVWIVRVPQAACGTYPKAASGPFFRTRFGIQPESWILAPASRHS